MPRHLLSVLLVMLSCWAVRVPAGAPATASARQSPPILSGCEYDYSPFCIVREDKQADGFSVQLLRAALAAMGREVTFKPAPWAELKQDLAEGRLQVLPMVARSAEREAQFDFTVPYLTMHGTIIVRQDNKDIHRPEDLKGKRVAVLQEDTAHEYLRKSNFGAVIEPLPSFDTAMRELSSGKHDAVVIQKLLAFEIIKNAGLANLRSVGPPLTDYSQVFCFAVRKGDKELLGLLNEGLSIVMADGTFRRLHAEWFSSLESLGHANSRVIVGGDCAYPPYEFLDENGRPAGYNVDLTRAIARQMGISVEIRLMPWANIRDMARQGDIDIVHGMFFSAERNRDFVFSPPHTFIQHVIAQRRNTPPLADLNALKGKSILVMSGDIMQDWAIKNGLEKQLVTVPTQEEALRLLAAGRHDCALVARVPALYWIKKRGWTNLRVSGQTVLSPEYCYAAGRINEGLLADFAEGLAAIKQTGEYRAIQNKWLGPYEETHLNFRTVLQYVLLGALPLAALLLGSLAWTRSLRAQVQRRTLDLIRETENSLKIAEALRESEARFRMVLRNAPVSVAAQNRELRYIWAYNQKTIPPEGIIGKLDSDIFTPEEMAHITPLKRRVLEENIELREQMWLNRPTGRIFLDICWEPLHDEAGNVIGVGSATVDMTPIKLAEEALRVSEEKFTKAFAMNPAAIALTRLEDGLILDVNGTWQEVSGYRRDEVIGRSTRQLHIWPSAEAAARFARELREKGFLHGWEQEFHRKSGEIYVAQLSAQLLTMQGEQVILSTLIDITKRKRAEEALQKANEQLREADRRKDEFLAMLAHELRNPLAPIRNSAQILKLAGANEAIREKNREIIDRQASHMGRLLEDLLDVSRVTRGKITLKLEAVDLRTVVMQALEVASHTAHGRRLELVYDNPPEPVWIEGDFTRLEQVVGNLLNNALKYSDEGRIQVRLACQAGNNGNAPRAIVRVRDNGIGIAPDMLPRVFELFAQADQSLERPRGGLGIGLTMVKRLVELHGGRVEAHSAGLGQGSEFTVYLPLWEKYDQGVRPGAQEPPASGRNENPVKVLVVDDNQDAASSLKDLLEMWGYKARIAMDGQEGIQLALMFQPDVILLDIGLPGMSGYAVARKLRGEPALESVKIFALTGYGQEEDRKMTRESGFDDHLVKPVDPQQLKSLLSFIEIGS